MTNKEKKKILKQFAKCDAHIAQLQKEKEEIYSSIKTSNFENVPGERQNMSVPEKAMKLIEDINNKIKNETDKLLELKSKIFNAILEVENITEREILILYYIGEKQPDGRYKQFFLWQIANKIGYSTDRVNHLHCDAVKHINF